MNKKPLVIGIAGPSGSGKTVLSTRLRDAVGPQLQIIQEDSYYRDLRHLPLAERADVNFDHPDAFEHSLLITQLQQLLAGQDIEQPQYDYSQHLRSPDIRHIRPSDVLIIEGILIFNSPVLREMMDIKVFVDAPSDICLTRRIRRDTSERGRSVESVLSQFESTVRPMYLAFVLPSKSHADIILPHGGASDEARDLLQGFIHQRCERTTD